MTDIERVKQALAAAENSIRLAKQLLNEGETHTTKTEIVNKPAPQPERAGVTGIYDGEKMVTAGGEVYPVPGNYASKSLLVVGDTLKMYEENGEKRFKQIEHVKRHKTTGLLVKKDGKFRAITPEGSYKVLSESISHFNGDVGDEVILHLPAGNLTSPFGAIETVHKKTKGEANQPEEEEEVKQTEPSKVEKVEEKKVEHSQSSEKPKAQTQPKPVEKPKPKKEEPKPTEEKPAIKPAVHKEEDVVSQKEASIATDTTPAAPNGEDELS